MSDEFDPQDPLGLNQIFNPGQQQQQQSGGFGVPFSLDFLQNGLVDPGAAKGPFGGLDLPDKFSVINSGVGAFSTLANMYAGFKALGLQKDQFNFQKEAFSKNFGANAKAFNNEVKDRGISRQASRGARGGSFDSASLESFVAYRRINP